MPEWGVPVGRREEMIMARLRRCEVGFEKASRSFERRGWSDIQPSGFEELSNDPLF